MASNCTRAIDATQKHLQQRWRDLNQQLDSAAAEDIEGIHQMRVASRRWRALLATHHAMLRNRPAKSLLREVRAITRNLGKARELDVTLALLEGLHPSLDETATPALVDVIGHLRDVRDAERDAVTEGIQIAQSDELKALRKDLAKCVSGKGVCYRKQSKIELTRAYKDLCKNYRAWKKEPTEEGVHAIRIAFKKFRYSCESFRNLYGKRMTKVLKELKKTQESLGEWNDYRIARDYVIAIGEDAPDDLKPGFTALTKRLEAESARRLEAFAKTATAYFEKSRRKSMLELLDSPGKSCC
jgi:CHAD domain-containing protein